MPEAIFYRSNGEILCQCGLDTDSQSVLNRKYGFEALLDKKRSEGILQDHVLIQYKKQVISFLLDLSKDGYLQLDGLPIDDNFLYRIMDTHAIKCLYNAMGSNGDKNYHNINMKKGKGSPRACLRYYLEFLENRLEKGGSIGITYWIFPSNPKIFDSISEFQKKSMIEWEKNCNAKDDDIVFLYITEPTQALAIQTRVQKVDDKIWLELIKFIEPQIPLKDLQQYADINANIQGPQKIKEQKYIDFILNYPQSLKGTQQKEGATMLENNKIPLNQILYGPPGTGKTYTTIIKALEILKSYGEINEIPENREGQKEQFDAFKAKGQIGFVTFHQSYGYEEFVEGIKPNVDFENSSNKMEYIIKDGIFKEMCIKAQNVTKTLKDNKEIEINEHTKVWKMSLGNKNKGEAEKLQEHCFDKEEIRIGFDDEDDKKSVPKFLNEMKPNDIVCVLHDVGTISLVGIILSEVYEDEGVTLEKRTEHFKRFRKVKWLNTLGDRINIKDLNGGKNLTQQTTYELHIEPARILEYIKDFKSKTDNTLKPHILIIDEINRGNISKILGELITLIEPSKRIGESEALEVQLPYSQESFGVPKNLYIIGTMNTADRSIALLDTALRRRFDFIEMMPDYRELQQNCEGINLQKLLETMNNRIEFLLDREHTIGHAFLINAKNIDDLQSIFKNKIIPLLQEYFYDDYAKIDAVLNYNGMIEAKSMDEVGINLSEEFVDSEKKVYKITEVSTWKKEHFQKIYDNKKIESSTQDENE